MLFVNFIILNNHKTHNTHFIQIRVIYVIKAFLSTPAAILRQKYNKILPPACADMANYKLSGMRNFHHLRSNELGCSFLGQCNLLALPTHIDLRP